MGFCCRLTDTEHFICADLVLGRDLTICSFFFFFRAIRELQKLLTFREGLTLVRSTKSIEREMGRGRPDHALSAGLLAGSACAQRGNFTEKVWKRALVVCGCDTSPLGSIAPLFPDNHTRNKCHVKSHYGNSRDGLSDTFWIPDFCCNERIELKTVRHIRAVVALGWDRQHGVESDGAWRAMERGAG